MRALWSAGLVVCVVGVAARAAEPSREARRTPVVIAYEKARDSVVNIAASQTVIIRRSPAGFGSLLDEMFRFPDRKVTRKSAGSGFVIHRDGYIVTNAHVVARTTSRKVIFSDGRSLDAEIVAIDTEHDLAVLRVDAPWSLKALKLGRSDDLMIAETVIAVGNPLGYQNTVTMGVISALDRKVEFSNNEVAYTGLIQTQAPINPGNSGGPLLNINGELIGINTAIRADAQNIGFAIPVDQLRRLLPEMLDLERLNQAFIGMRVTGGDQATVTSLHDAGPAHRAGLKLEDRITAVDGAPTPRDIDVYFELLAKRPGQRVRFTVRRNGKPKRIDVTIAEVPAPEAVKLARQKLGLDLEPLGPAPARRLGLRGGVMVTGVERRGPGERIGIEPGDILHSIGRYYVSSLDDAGHLLKPLERGTLVQIAVLRPGRRGPEQFEGTIQSR